MNPNSNNTLPPGFISVEDAVELIKSDTREDPKVDTQYLMDNLRWIDVQRNVRIPRLRKLPADKVYRTPQGKVISFERPGSVNVAVSSAYERELLKETIRNKFKELSGQEYQEQFVRASSTVADDAQGKEAVRPRANKPIAEPGSAIGGGEVTTNGEGITV